jgi:hypothetical protein
MATFVREFYCGALLLCTTTVHYCCVHHCCVHQSSVCVAASHISLGCCCELSDCRNLPTAASPVAAARRSSTSSLHTHHGDTAAHSDVDAATHRHARARSATAR